MSLKKKNPIPSSNVQVHWNPLIFDNTVVKMCQWILWILCLLNITLLSVQLNCRVKKMTMKTKRWRKPWTTLLVQGTEQSARKVEQTENKNERITQALGQRKHLNAESVFTVIWASTRHVYPFDCSEKEAETHLCPQPWRCNELVNKQPLYGREQLQPLMTLDHTFKERQMMSADSTWACVTSKHQPDVQGHTGSVVSAEVTAQWSSVSGKEMSVTKQLWPWSTNAVLSRWGIFVAIGCLQTRDSDDPWNAAEGQEGFFSVDINSRNSRCLWFEWFMNTQIGQTEKTQGAFIVYEHVLFIRGEKSRNWQKNAGKGDL